jgi:hypothetical protein
VKVAKCEGSKTVGAVCGQLGGGAQDIHYQRIDPGTLLLLYVKFAPSTPVLSLYKYRRPKVVHVMTQSKDPMQVLVTSRRCRGLLDVVLLMRELTRLSTRLPAAWGRKPADVTVFPPWPLMLEFPTNVYVM